MANVIALKIDVKKIDKARLYIGEKGTYLDCVLMLNLEKDQYGQNGMIVESVSKEERESGVKGTILGNAKILSWDATKGVTAERVADVMDAEVVDPKDDLQDLPF